MILDTSIVNVALDSISEDLATDVTGLQWVVTAYVLAFASLVLSGGALGDTHGARRIYGIGLVLFTAASLVCGSAPSLPALIAGRVLQGVGAALLVPCALSLLTHAYPDGAARARAIATWASCGGVAQVLGPIVGGLLIAAFGWRGIFFVNVPICLVGLWLTFRIDGRSGDHGTRRVDWPGQLSAALAMVLLIAALIEGPELGWDSGRVVAALALSGLSALSFVVVERRSDAPMLPLTLFSSPIFSWVSVAGLLGSAVFFGMLFVLNLYFLRDAGLTPIETGIAMLPLALFATIGNLASARLARRSSPLGLMIVGAVLRLAGFAGLAVASADPSYARIAVPLLLIGLGAGLSNPMSISVMLSAVDRRYAGVTSGTSTSTGQLGAAIGVAVFGAFLADARRVADGMLAAAVVSTVTAALILGIVWTLRQRAGAAGRG